MHACVCVCVFRVLECDEADAMFSELLFMKFMPVTSVNGNVVGLYI